MKYTLIILVTLVSGLAIYVWMNQSPDIPVEELTERWAQPPSQFIKIAGMNVHLRDEGPRDDPNPIVLIHGTSASLHTWDGWVSELVSQKRVIRFDLPGFGLTGPHPQNNYTIEAYADVVVSVLDTLNVDTAILGGNSLGGYIAWATAVLHPQRVTQLVLVDASGLPFEAESVPIAFILSQYPILEYLLDDFLPISVVASSVKNVYGNPDIVTDELVHRYYELSLREGNRDALRARFAQTQPGDLAAKVASINVPTLIIWGGLDRLIPLGVGQRLNQAIINSELVVFEQLGHVPHEEDPIATVTAVKAFLSGSQ
ncbi:alpha/beta hydrolase [Glaciecola sp. XM2]|uniref:alpha/beta fold hydrolase n=1 Tax=Glaciecola sp. XM2 TaxID=1914931 RepID=UPI002032DF12|nr:alpha/beta hydrolase [Glaciecola sp. XM2]